MGGSQINDHWLLYLYNDDIEYGVKYASFLNASGSIIVQHGNSTSLFPSFASTGRGRMDNMSLRDKVIVRIKLT